MAEARVLVVDDDPEVVRLLEQDLTAGGFTVLPACSGAAAVRLLRESPVVLGQLRRRAGRRQANRRAAIT